MNEEIFRKKSLDKARSPENLNDYIHVTNPGVWILMISIIVLLAGACVWGFFGRIESSVSSVVTVENGAVECVVSAENFTSLTPGMKVRFDSYEGEITSISTLDNGSYVCEVSAAGTPTDGTFSGTVVTKTVSPMSFILN